MVGDDDVSAPITESASRRRSVGAADGKTWCALIFLRLAASLPAFASRLPHATRSGQEVIIPAGSLQDDPGLRPTLHVMLEFVRPVAVRRHHLAGVSGRADWLVIGDRNGSIANSLRSSLEHGSTFGYVSVRARRN
jgi:hypothetical protein